MSKRRRPPADVRLTLRLARAVVDGNTQAARQLADDVLRRQLSTIMGEPMITTGGPSSTPSCADDPQARRHDL